ASPPCRVPRLMLWISSTQTRVVAASRQTPQTASSTSVTLERRAEEPGELDRDHPRGRGRRGGDAGDGDVPGGVRVPAVVHRLDGLAELGQAGGLAGAGGAGQDQAAPAGV